MAAAAGTSKIYLAGHARQTKGMKVRWSFVDSFSALLFGMHGGMLSKAMS
jgi:hypothetical protein